MRFVGSCADSRGETPPCLKQTPSLRHISRLIVQVFSLWLRDAVMEQEAIVNNACAQVNLFGTPLSTNVIRSRDKDSPEAPPLATQEGYDTLSQPFGIYSIESASFAP